MNLRQLLVVVVCGGIGYFIVSLLLSRGAPSKGRPPPQPRPDDAGRRASSANIEADSIPSSASASDEVTLTNWYRILGVAESASKDDIAAAYRRRISEYHPDKVAQMGDEIRALAEQKSKQINAAYELGMRRYS